MKKRIVSLIMAMTMVSALFVGCGSDKSKKETSSSVPPTTNEAKPVADGEIDISEPVTLTMYLLGEKSKDFDMVYDEIKSKSGLDV